MQSRRAYSVLLIALAALAWHRSPAANAATITPGNLVVYRVGTGAAALSTPGVAVFLDEYTTTGTLVQSISVPSTGASALTAIGNSTTEGIVSRSQDGNKLVFGGYRADAGTASPNVAGNNRVVGSVDAGGTVDTSIAVTGLSTAVPRSATTVDGTTYYLGTSTNVYYVASPGPAATAVVVDARNSRQVNLANSVLYASNGSTAITGKVQSYGTLPTGVTAPTVVANQLITDAVNGFALFDLNAGVAGVDTLYFLNTVQSQLVKFSFDGTSWLANGTIGTVAAANLAGVNNGGTVTLYLTTASKLQTLTDASGHNATITGTVSDLATAGTNTAFRGLGLFDAVVPEPGTAMLVLAALACAGVGLRRMGR
jgi:hypothetical protein